MYPAIHVVAHAGWLWILPSHIAESTPIEVMSGCFEMIPESRLEYVLIDDLTATEFMQLFEHLMKVLKCGFRDGW